MRLGPGRALADPPGPGAAPGAERMSGVTVGSTFSRAARTRRGIAGLVVGAAGVGLALSAAFSGQPAKAGSATLPGLRIPAAAVPRLNAIVASFARANGGKRPAWATAVLTTHAKALESASPGDTEPGGGTVVYLVTMKGHFTAYDASVPAGAALPTGSYVSIVVNARTFRITDWGISPKAPPVSPASLGLVRDLRP
jgi:hypothetical protein